MSLPREEETQKTLDASDRCESPVDDKKSEDLHPAGEHVGASGSSEAVEQVTRDRVATSVGVRRMEAIARAGERRPVLMWTVRLCILTTGWMYSLQNSTTYSYEPLATSSFSQHSSGLAALAIATEIIAAVCKPFLAKISDLAGRPNTFTLVLCLYTMGFIIVASSATLSAYIVGDVFISIGFNGISFLCTVIIADLTPLKWRGLAQGLVASPYIINTWIAGYIVSDLSEGELWRWGYGMFAVIAPVVLIPAIVTLVYFEHKALKASDKEDAEKEQHDRSLGLHVAADADAKPVEEIDPLAHASLLAKTKRSLEEIDAFGLLLLGFGWSLLLLPFALSSTATNGYANRSLIAMFVVGGLSLIGYLYYELRWSKFPTFPMRILKNRTFILAVVIDFIYLLAGNLSGLYFSSYVYITQDWSVRDWTYSNNTLTMALCVFGVVAGVYLSYFRRYKGLQIFGLGLKIIGQGLLVRREGVRSGARLIMSQVLIGTGGSFSVIGTQVASQASVPHQDVALIISLLSLWSTIGGSVGAAVAGSVWGDLMPKQLREQLPASVSDAQVMEYFGSITSVRALEYDSPVRQGAIKAYENTVWHLWPAALGLSFVPFICACFMPNFYLGDQQNAFDNHAISGEAVSKEDAQKVLADEEQRKQTPWYQFWRR